MNEWFPVRRYRRYRTYVITLTCGHHITSTARPAMNCPVYGCWCVTRARRAVAVCEIR